MMNNRRIAWTVMVALAGAPAVLDATPTTQIWTPCTADVQAFRVWHLTYDTYFTVARKLAKGGHAFPVNLGLTVGLLSGDRIGLEVGADLFEPTDDPLQLNLKVGTPEGKIAPGAPGLAVGIYGVGTARGKTDYNVVYGAATKTVGLLGRLHLGYYRGNPDLLVRPDGRADSRGVMVAWDRVLIKDRLVLAGDWQQGENALGAGGVGLSYSFAPNVGVIFGYTVFNAEALNGKPTVTVQLDVNIE